MTFFLPRFSSIVSRVIVSPVILVGVLALTMGNESAGLAQDDTATKPAESKESVEDDTDPGQSELDEAAVLRFDAQSLRDLTAVEKLLKSAIDKGLTGENLSFAKKMLGSVYMQEAQQIIANMARARGQSGVRMRDDALARLEDAIREDPELVEAYLLIARINAISPDGDKDAIYEASTKAIELLKDDPNQRSVALLMRAVTYGPGEQDKLVQDLDAAIKADGQNLEALTRRAAIRLKDDDVDGAMEDLKAILEIDPTNRIVAEEAVNQLIELQRIDEAIELLTKAIEAKPSEGLYRMRGVLKRMTQKEDEAFADFNRALAIQPKDPVSLLQRAELAVGRKDIKSAKEDLKSALAIAPQVAQSDSAIFVRCLIAIEESRMADAINDMKELVSRDPSADLRQLQLAQLYLQDDRPRKAIETFTIVLERDPNNLGLLRTRADILLSVGDHAKAISDYERALKIAGDSDENAILSGILNNLSWVLATSPNDDVRDGKRAVELGKRAVELTEEKEAHILSTLAAAYAEAGDFKQAVQWSTKAVDVGKSEEHDQQEQLEQELESYKQGKPWREKQETEENAVPILPPDDLIDT